MASQKSGDHHPVEREELMLGVLGQSRYTLCLDVIFTQGGENNHLVPPPVSEGVACKHMENGEGKVDVLTQTVIRAPVFCAD